jgi:hypothetical protein
MMTKTDQALLESLIREAFERPRDPRSAEYKEGVRALLACRIAGIPVVCPHPPSSDASDAFYSGKDEGCRIWRDHVPNGPQVSSMGAPPVRGFSTSATDLIRMVIAAAVAAQSPGSSAEERCALFAAGLAGSLGCHRGTEEAVDALLLLAEISPQRRPTLIG